MKQVTKMDVVEIFDSMQGEGEYMGVMCTFVRFSGCNLSCHFCDERLKYPLSKAMTIPQIVKKCKQDTIVLTGGEPTIQPALRELMDALGAAGKQIHIETNGTNVVPYESRENVYVTCSPKAPHFVVNCNPDEIKLVVDEDLKINTALQIADNHCDYVWLQPCDGPELHKSVKKILQWLKKYPDKFRAGIQLHKWYGVV